MKIALLCTAGAVVSAQILYNGAAYAPRYAPGHFASPVYNYQPYQPEFVPDDRHAAQLSYASAVARASGRKNIAYGESPLFKKNFFLASLFQDVHNEAGDDLDGWDFQNNEMLASFDPNFDRTETPKNYHSQPMAYKIGAGQAIKGRQELVDAAELAKEAAFARGVNYGDDEMNLLQYELEGARGKRLHQVGIMLQDLGRFEGGVAGPFSSYGQMAAFGGLAGSAAERAIALQLRDATPFGQDRAGAQANLRSTQTDHLANTIEAALQLDLGSGNDNLNRMGGSPILKTVAAKKKLESAALKLRAAQNKYDADQNEWTGLAVRQAQQTLDAAEADMIAYMQLNDWYMDGDHFGNSMYIAEWARLVSQKNVANLEKQGSALMYENEYGVHPDYDYEYYGFPEGSAAAGYGSPSPQAPAYGRGYPQAPAYGRGYPQGPAYGRGYPQGPGYSPYTAGGLL